MNFWTYFRSKRALSLAFISVAALAAVTAGACSGSSDAASPYGVAASTPTSAISSAATYPMASPAASSAATPASGMKAGTASPLAIGVKQGDLGAFLTGPSGKTLYVFARDAKNVSNCDAACVATWPPLLARDGQTIQGGMGATGAFGRISTASGAQVTYNAAPLYYFAGDSLPGDTRGNGIGGVWSIARP